MKRNCFLHIFLLGLLGVLVLPGCTKKYDYPFQNPNLPLEERVNDLVSHLTLEEKVAQMMNNAPAIERLGIPAYGWWNECLHGIGRTNYKTTVFPQAIGMAACWDEEAMQTMADITATEGRAIFADHTGQNNGNASQYYGLTYWTPNVNIFRDPRWGRGQETYGEDPYLTGMLGKAFVKGLEGTDSKYLKASACAKHYAVHSGPEKLRHVFDVSVTGYDLWDTYLPAFYDLVVESNVSGVMCAYNAYEGAPCCGSKPLMIDILRKKWGFTGYVTSDCGAINDFWKMHKTHPGKAEASADAVWNGTDTDCGDDSYAALVDAVKTGLITEAQIDESVKRLFTIRFRLGMFDPQEKVKYAQTPINVLESEPHRAHALKMAQQSIVLLENKNNALPLSKELKKIAVLGPNADNTVTPLGNYNGFPTKLVTPLEGIKAKVGANTEVYYEQGIGFVNREFFASINVEDMVSFEGKKGFKADYFDNKELQGTPVFTRMEANISHVWGEGSDIINEADGTRLKAADMSIRWVGEFVPQQSGEVIFEIAGDDGYRLYIDDKLCAEDWKEHGVTRQRYIVTMDAKQKYTIKIEYFQAAGGAEVKFTAGNNVFNENKAIANRVKDADVIVFVGGISPELEGEEMPVNAQGFDGGDRTTIALPIVQTELLKELKATGKPVILVISTGSAIGLEWEAANLDGILCNWYGGQAAGTALADVLFADYNPSGRLPVTFYKNDSQLPPFEDYNMVNRTYRYFAGEPQYGFGYGLSYTTFTYENLHVPAQTETGKEVKVKVKVSNTGSLAGDEVVELYLTHENDNGAITPLRALKGFKRIHLNPNESKEVEFIINPKELATVDTEGQLSQNAGKLLVSVGGQQATTQSLKAGKVLQAPIELTGNKVIIY